MVINAFNFFDKSNRRIHSFDEYNNPKFPGAKLAVDKFLKKEREN